MKRSPKWFIGIVICLAVLGGLGMLMIRNGFSTRIKPTVVEASLAMSLRKMAIPSRYKTINNPVKVTPDVIHEGMAHWADHCASCHANNGSGDTMYGRTMYPRPPDMRKKDTKDLSDGELYYTIKNGIRLSGMPAFGDPGDDDLDSWKLVAFIRHLSQLSDQEQMEMEHLNPKSPDEMQEEQEENQFLNGGKAPAPTKMPATHH